MATIFRIVATAYAAALITPWAVAEETPTESARTLRKSEDLGLIFCYDGEKSVEEFLTSTPCVSGVWWSFSRENDKHWIGELHYPTENTADYAKEGKDRSPQYYMVFDLAIRKQPNLPIDMKKFRGALVLRDPNPDVPLAMRGDGTSYELVGYQDEQSKKAGYRFLFSTHAELRYTPSKNDEGKMACP